MTGPRPETDVEALRQLARERGYSEQEIEAKLQQAGLAQSGPSLGQQFMHGAGLIGRMAVQGVGNMASMPFGLAGAGYQAMTGNQPPAMLQGGQGTAAADRLGLPKPQGAGERIASAVGENAVGGMAMPGGGAMTAALGGAQGLVGQGVQEAGGGPMAQMAAQGAVGMGIPVVGYMLGAMTRAALAGVATKREAAKQSLALMQAGDPNAPVTLGQVSQGGLGRMLDSRLRKVPGAAETFQGALEGQAAGLGQRTQGIATSIGPIRDPIQVGRAVQRGIEQGFIPRFRATSEQLYNKVDHYVPAETPVTMPNTAALMEAQNKIGAAAGPLEGLLHSPFMKPWWEALASASEQMPQGVQWQVISHLRSRLGHVLSGAEAVADINMGEAKRLYGAMTKDMGQTVAQVGGSDGMNAWNRATLFTKKGHDRLEGVLQPLLDKKTPEIAYRALMSGTREGGTVLRSTMQSLQPEQRRLITSTVLGRMGMAEPGGQSALGDVFSPDQFLTNWNKLSPVAKGALFNRVDAYAAKDLDQLAKATQLVKDANKRMPNPAGTASNTAFNAIISGLGLTGVGLSTGNVKMAAGGLAPLAAVTAAQQLSKRVLTNPKTIHWLVSTTKFPLGMLSKQLALLAKDSQKWDVEGQGIATDLIDTLKNMDWHQVMMGQALTESAVRQSAP